LLTLDPTLLPWQVSWILKYMATATGIHIDRVRKYHTLCIGQR
jgi:hypothetical protein